MQYKLVATDIDGTLLNSKSELTPHTIDTIQRSIANGLIFAISTGRPIQGVQFFAKLLEVDMPFITYNGAMVIMSKSQKILYEQKLAAHDAADAIRLGKQYGTTVLVWADNQLYVTEHNEKTEHYKTISTIEPILVPSFDDIIANGVSKVLWYDEESKIEQYRIEVGAHISKQVNFHPSRPIFLEFVDKDATKAIGMQKIGEHYGIKQEEMIAIGDGFNDLSMIEYAGLGIVMANAKDVVKEKADFITKSNDEDGVAYAIEKFIL